jgi:peptide/nickel transport system substrate-binding protein
MKTKLTAMVLAVAAIALWCASPCARPAAPGRAPLAGAAGTGDRASDQGVDPQLRFAGKRFDPELKTDVVTWFKGKDAGDELIFEGRGRPGGRLVTGQAQSPREFNPITTRSTASSDIVNQALFVGLIDYNYDDDCFYPLLIRGWENTLDGKNFTFYLRHDLQWSDGHPLTLDDVFFTWQVITSIDNSYEAFFKQSDGSYPELVRVGDDGFRFTLKEPSATFVLGVGSLRLVPKHVLGPALEKGEFGSAYGLGTDPEKYVCNGPFKLKKYVPDERVVLERNPHYVRMGHDLDGKLVRLPYMDEFVFKLVPSMDAQFLSFLAGDVDLLYPLQPANYQAAKEREEQKHDIVVTDLGPITGSNILILNQNPGKSAAGAPLVDPVKLAWFQNKQFRQAIAYAIDREAIVKNAFASRAVVETGEKMSESRLWNTPNLKPRYLFNPEKARGLLKEAGFRYREGDKVLEDREGHPVSLVLNTNGDNNARVMMATMIQKDLADLGIKVLFNPLEIGALTEKLTRTYEWEAVVIGLSSGVPNDPLLSRNLYLSSGAQHLWYPGQAAPATDWEKHIDDLMFKNSHALTYVERKSFWDEVQQVLAEEQPMIWLVKYHDLVAARVGLRNYRPSVLRPQNFWNLEELSWGN